MPVLPELRGLKRGLSKVQDQLETRSAFQASRDDRVRPYLKKKTKIKKVTMS